ncbi:MAG TPA: M23 family metallopeptidase [Bacteroidales bacterium]|nr:M23 family metallopeptidase [Bacteroidales bacterium]
MKKTKYHFNTKTLSFEEFKVSVKQKFFRFFSILTSGMVISAVFMLVLYSFIDSPKERVLKRENEKLKLQYSLLDNRMDQISAVLANMQNRDDNIYRTIFEAEPIPDNVRKAGYGGEDRYKDLKGYDNSDLMKNTAMRLDMISRQLYVQSKSFDEIILMAKNKEKMLSCIPAIQPVSKTRCSIVSGFGYRIHPIYKTARMHTGIDFAAKTGTPIYATGDGTVVDPKGNQSGYGIVCVINHGFGFQSLYGHMSKMIVKPGDKVKRGQVIGFVGSTGLSVAPHCHYEIIKNGNKINPVNYFYNDLTPQEYEKVIEQASKLNQSLS